MRSITPTIALTISMLLFNILASAQQYVGDVISNSLPSVPGREITYFRIKDASGKNNNLTLINYYSHQDSGQRIVESQIQRAVVIIHGLNRDPGTYESNIMSALAQVTTDPNVNRSTVALMAPYFPNGDDKNYGYPWTNGLSPGRGSTTNCLVWSGSQWSAGGNNQYPYNSHTTSSYTVLDQLIQYFDNTTLFPNMKQIVIAGHSLGGQTVQRYAAIQQLTTRSPVSYWVANPNSYVWLSYSRPLPTTSCPIFDVYREGYTNFTLYPMTYGVSLVQSGRSNVLANWNNHAIAYARGTLDLGDDSSDCAPFTTGANRNERFFNYIAAFPPSCPNPAGNDCDTVDFVNAGHDAGQMMASQAGQARLFLDNFYGNGSRAYDFGYPRQQAGDDPYPNPALNGTLAAVNNNTYAGNMTYWGCWSAQSPPSLTNMIYNNNANTIELCTSTCAQGGNIIAGLEYGTQCFCGSSLGYLAQEVIDSSCATACPGNSSEICGGQNRLSLFSNGRPAVQPAPGIPESVDNDQWYYTACYTEATNGRALTATSTSGQFMTLEYCANYCNAYQYFGTEYSSEQVLFSIMMCPSRLTSNRCYCGNNFSAGANITSDNDCDMLCANNTAEFCGGPDRLTVYQNQDWTPPSTTLTTSGSTSTTTSPGSSSTGLSCPASNNTLASSGGKTFLIECGIDRAGGDLTNTNVNSFQGCIDACAQNSQCVDVSLSGNTCYFKSTVMAPVSNAGIWGAKLVTSGSTTSTGSGPSTSTGSSIATGVSTTSTSSSSPTTSHATCPGSNSTIFTSTNGKSFLIECGIDHAGGDVGPPTIANSLTDCINDCAMAAGCVDVSLSGNSCYMKSVVGSPVYNGVFGAKLVASPSTTTSTSISLSTSTALSSTSLSSSSSSNTLTTSSTVISSSATASSSSTLSSIPTTSLGSTSSSSVTVPQSTIASTSSSTSSGPNNLPSSGSSSSSSTSLSSLTRTSASDSGSTSSTTSSSSSSSVLPTPISTTTLSSSSSSSGSGTGSASSSIDTTSSSSSSSLPTSTAAPTSGPSSTTPTTLMTTSSSATATSSSSSSLSTSASGSPVPSTSSSALPSSTPSSSSSSTSSSTISTTAVSASSTSLSTSTSSASSSSNSASSSSTSSVGLSSSTTPSTATSAVSTSSSSSTSGSVRLSIATTSIATTSSTSSSSTSSSRTTSATTSSSSSTSSSSISSSRTFSSSSSSTSTLTSSPSTFSTRTSTTSSAGTSTTSSTSSPNLPSGFASVGCFFDSVSARVLPHANGTSSTQTPSQCALNCQALGYKYSGTEYASECWCGASLPPTPALSTDCNFKCTGNKTQICGAGNRLSVVVDNSWKQTFFVATSYKTWVLTYCYVDSTSSRLLKSSVSLSASGGNNNATIGNCMDACAAKGFGYCGEEYYSECYGSNTAPPNSAIAVGADPLSAGCKYPCRGNSSEACGGSDRILVYANTAVVALGNK